MHMILSSIILGGIHKKITPWSYDQGVSQTLYQLDSITQNNWSACIFIF